LSTSPDNLHASGTAGALAARRAATRRSTARALAGAADGPRATSAKLTAVSGVDVARAEAAVRELLLAIGENPLREGLCDTPARVARAYQEMFAGQFTDPAEVLETTFEEGHDELVLVKDIPLYSVCEHHLVPWHGRAAVGYVPGSSGRVVGLSKLARLVDLYAKRPQLQERLTATGRRRGAEPAGSRRGDRGRAGAAPVHGDARHPKAGMRHGDLGCARPFQNGRTHPQRGDDANSQALSGGRSAPHR
jgi:hypothetical protein